MKKLKYNLKKLPKNSYIQIRSKNGYIKKPDKRTKYVIEVRSRKTKKVIGYLNDKDYKTKKPIFQNFKNFKNFQKDKMIYERLVKRVFTIELTNKSFMLDQIATKGKHVVQYIQKFAKRHEVALIDLEINSKDNPTIKPLQTTVHANEAKELIIKKLALDGVVNNIRAAKMRISPKKYARSGQEQRTTLTKIELKIYVSKIKDI